MASELHGMLSGAVSLITGEVVMPTYGGGPEAFLSNVVSPIYDVIHEVLWILDLFTWRYFYGNISNSPTNLLKEAMKNRNGTTDHSTWRNYDDLNEFFW